MPIVLWLLGIPIPLIILIMLLQALADESQRISASQILRFRECFCRQRLVDQFVGCRPESFSFGNVYAMTGRSFAALGLSDASGAVA